MAHDGASERLAVVDRGDDLEAAVAQQAVEPVAQQREVLGDHDAHGSSARTSVGPPGGLSIAQRAVERLDALCAGRSGRCPSGSAPPRAVVGDLDVQARRRAASTQTGRARAPLCLAALASASETTK